MIQDYIRLRVSIGILNHCTPLCVRLSEGKRYPRLNVIQYLLRIEIEKRYLLAPFLRCFTSSLIVNASCSFRFPQVSPIWFFVLSPFYLHIFSPLPHYIASQMCHHLTSSSNLSSISSCLNSRQIFRFENLLEEDSIVMIDSKSKCHTFKKTPWIKWFYSREITDMQNPIICHSFS
jgi:hypothetical protein